MSEEPRRKDFIDPVVATPIIFWVIKVAGGAMLYTVVAFFTKIGLKRYWESDDENDVDLYSGIAVEFTALPEGEDGK